MIANRGSGASDVRVGVLECDFAKTADESNLEMSCFPALRRLLRVKMLRNVLEVNSFHLTRYWKEGVNGGVEPGHHMGI